MLCTFQLFIALNQEHCRALQPEKKDHLVQARDFDNFLVSCQNIFKTILGLAGFNKTTDYSLTFTTNCIL